MTIVLDVSFNDHQQQQNNASSSSSSNNSSSSNSNNNDSQQSAIKDISNKKVKDKYRDKDNASSSKAALKVAKVKTKVSSHYHVINWQMHSMCDCVA